MNKKAVDLQALMDEKHEAFCKKNGTEPLYASCQIRYKNDGTTFETTLMMASGSEDEDDDDIFYYCDNFSGLKGLTEPDGCTDFFITDFFYFY